MLEKSSNFIIVYSLLLAAVLAASMPQNCLAKFCSAVGGSSRAEEGKIIEREYHDVSGIIDGFDEYTFKGIWNGAVDYKTGDSVIFAEIFWRASSDNVGHEPSLDTTVWVKVDAKKYLRQEESIVWGFYFWPQDTVAETGSIWEMQSHIEKISVYDENTAMIQSSCSGGFTDFSELIYYDDSSFVEYKYTPSCDGYYEINDPDYIYYENVPYGDVEPPPNAEGVVSIKTSKSLRIDYEDSGHVVDGDYEEFWGDFFKSYSLLSEPILGSVRVAKAMNGLNLDSEDWEPGTEAYAWLGSWEQVGSSFRFAGRAIRFALLFDCISENAEIVFTYRVWPIGGNEKDHGSDRKETRTVQKSQIEDTEQGRKVTGFYIIPDDGLNKRFVKAVLKNPCVSSSGETNGGDLKSMDWWVSLGKGDDGATVGNLRVEESVMSSKSATPVRLKYDGGINPEVNVLSDDFGGVRQIIAPESFVDVIVLDDYSYEVRFYDPAEVEPECRTVSIGLNPLNVEVPTGLYKANGLPLSVWKVENPDREAAHSKVTISHIVGDGNEVYEFEEAAGVWSLKRGDGLQREELTKTLLGNGDILSVSVTKFGGSISSSKVETIERYFNFGRRTIENIRDPDGAALTTTWEYYDDALLDGGAYSQIKAIIYPDGSWERYEYDSEGRESKIIRPWLDGGIASSESASRVTEKTHSVVSGETTVTIIEKIEGQEVSRRYWVKSADGSEITNIVCTVPGAAINASSNLITLTKSITVGEFKGQVESISHPDGTLTTYAYSRDGVTKVLTTTMRTGAKSGANVVSGREIVTTEDAKGQLLSHTEKDIASGIVVESYVISDRDDQGRPTLISYGDGTTEEKSYSCCGVETEKDRDGNRAYPEVCVRATT